MTWARGEMSSLNFKPTFSKKSCDMSSSFLLLEINFKLRFLKRLIFLLSLWEVVY